MAAAARGGHDGVAGKGDDALTGFIAGALVLIAVGIVVGAVVFRWRRAIEALRVLRRIGWAYVIAIVLLAVIYLVRDNGF